MSSDRQSLSETDSTEASDFHQPLDVQLHFSSQVAFHFIMVNFLTKRVELFFAEIIDPDIFADSGVFQDFFSSGSSNSINVCERDH